MAIEILAIDALGHDRFVDLLLDGPAEHVVAILKPHAGQCSTPVT